VSDHTVDFPEIYYCSFFPDFLETSGGIDDCALITVFSFMMSFFSLYENLYSPEKLVAEILNYDMF